MVAAERSADEVTEPISKAALTDDHQAADASYPPALDVPKGHSCAAFKESIASDRKSVLTTLCHVGLRDGFNLQHFPLPRTPAQKD